MVIIMIFVWNKYVIKIMNDNGNFEIQQKPIKSASIGMHYFSDRSTVVTDCSKTQNYIPSLEYGK